MSKMKYQILEYEFIKKEFIDINDKIDTLINFLEYCKIKNPVFTNIERSMFI